MPSLTLGAESEVVVVLVDDVEALLPLLGPALLLLLRCLLQSANNNNTLIISFRRFRSTSSLCHSSQSRLDSFVRLINIPLNGN